MQVVLLITLFHNFMLRIANGKIDYRNDPKFSDR